MSDDKEYGVCAECGERHHPDWVHKAAMTWERRDGMVLDAPATAAGDVTPKPTTMMEWLIEQRHVANLELLKSVWPTVNADIKAFADAANAATEARIRAEVWWKAHVAASNYTAGVDIKSSQSAAQRIEKAALADGVDLALTGDTGRVPYRDNGHVVPTLEESRDFTYRSGKDLTSLPKTE